MDKEERVGKKKEEIQNGDMRRKGLRRKEKLNKRVAKIDKGKESMKSGVKLRIKI